MKKIDLLAAVFKVFARVIWEIISENWRPFYTTFIKMSIISLILWTLCQFIPHGLPFLTGITYLGWLSIVIIYRLITVHYDDFESNEEPIDDVEEPEYNEEPGQQHIEQPVGNIMTKEENDGNSSTRE